MLPDYHTSMEISEKTTLSQAFVLILRDSGMAGGVINKEGCELPAREFYVPQSMPLSQALDQLTATDSRHRWAITGGGIALIPTDGIPVLL